MAKWYLSADEEIFDVGPFSSREEAVRAAPEELGLEPGEAFWVGVAVPAASCLSADSVISMLDDHAAEEGPDGHDGYDVSPTARAELDVLLAAWAEKHGVQPLWYDVDQVSRHEVPEERPVHQCEEECCLPK